MYLCIAGLVYACIISLITHSCTDFSKMKCDAPDEQRKHFRAFFTPHNPDHQCALDGGPNEISDQNNSIPSIT